jgi:lipoate-protein ligase A
VSEINLDELVKLEEKFSSWDWIYGKKMEFNYSLDRRFAWGDIDLRFVVDSGKIKQCAVYSDALETDLFEQLAQGLTGCVFAPEAMIKVIESMRMTPGIGRMQMNTGTQEKDFNTDIQNNILNDILVDIMTLIND